MAKKYNQRKRYVTVGLTMLMYTVIFSIMGLIFIIDKIPSAVKIIFGIVFEIPVILLTYVMGSREGADYYKAASNTSLQDVHNMKKIDAPLYKSLYYVISYAALPIVLLILAVSAKIVFLRGIVSILFMPFTLIYMGINILDFSVVRFSSFWMYFPVILITASVFVIGFIISVLKAKRRQGEIENEVRMYSDK